MDGVQFDPVVIDSSGWSNNNYDGSSLFTDSSGWSSNEYSGGGDAPETISTTGADASGYDDWSSNLFSGGVQQDSGLSFEKLLSGAGGLLNTKGGQLAALMAMQGIGSMGQKSVAEDMLKLRSELSNQEFDHQYGAKTAMRGNTGAIDPTGKVTAQKLLAALEKRGKSINQGGTNTGLLAAVQQQQRA